MTKALLAGLGIFTLAAVSQAQISVGGGFYLPTGKAAKDIFGASPFSSGIGFGRVDRAGRNGFNLDVSGVGLSNGSSRFFTLGATYGYERQQVINPHYTAFARVGTGFAYYDYAINDITYGVFSDRMIRSISTAEVGVVVNKNFSLSAQYVLQPLIKGLDYSGLRIQAQFSIGRF
jgi:hypothetical protein